MKVICVVRGELSPLAESKVYHLEVGTIYSVKNIVRGYSSVLEEYVDAYELKELDGYFDCRLFARISKIDEMIRANRFFETVI